MQGLHNTYYDISKATLWGEKQEGAEYAARMSLSYANGNPRLVVFPGTQGVSIMFPTDPTTMLMVCNRIKEMCNAPEGSSVIITSEKPKWVNGVKTEELEVRSRLQIGKTKKGIVYLMLKEEGKPEIAFGLMKSIFHTFYVDGGEKSPVVELSHEYARAFADILSNTVKYMVHQYQHDLYAYGENKPKVIEPFDPNKFKNNKGGTKSHGSQGVPKPSTKVDDFDDDIPF